MIDKLRMIAKKKYDIAKENEEKNKYMVIMKILEDDKCFFKMNISDAYNILEDLDVSSDDLKSIYILLVTKNISDK